MDDVTEPSNFASFSIQFLFIAGLVLGLTLAFLKEAPNA